VHFSAVTPSRNPPAEHRAGREWFLQSWLQSKQGLLKNLYVDGAFISKAKQKTALD